MRLVFLPLLIISITIFSQSINYPEPSEGWILNEESSTYNPENLWDYIDGAADSYVKNGFQSLEVKDYELGDSYISVEIYRFESAAHALGMYKLEKPESPESSLLNGNAYCENSNCNMWAGIYYVKIISNDTSISIKNEVINIAKNLYSNYGSSKLPNQYSYFIDEYKVKGSENFIASNFLGYDFFNNVYTCKFIGGDIGSTAFYMEFELPKDVKNALGQYSKLAEFTTKAKEGVSITVIDANNGEVVMMWKGMRLFGVVNPEDPGIAMEFMNATAMTY